MPNPLTPELIAELRRECDMRMGFGSCLMDPAHLDALLSIAERVCPEETEVTDKLKIMEWCGGPLKDGHVPSVSVPKSELLDRHCHAAELVFIERGLSEEYGRELQDQLWPNAKHVTCIIPPSFEAYIAAAATAPLDSRVRAMVAVIDSLEDRP